MWSLFFIKCASVPCLNPAIVIWLAHACLKFWVHSSDTRSIFCSFRMFIIRTSEHTAAAACVEGETEMVSTRAQEHTYVLIIAVMCVSTALHMRFVSKCSVQTLENGMAEVTCESFGLCSVLVLKKLGDEQWDSYLRVLRYLGKEENMRVVVEPHEYLKLSQRTDLNFVDTYNHDEAGRYTSIPCSITCRCRTNPP